MEVTRADCESFVDALMAMPETERPGRIWAMGARAVEENAPLLPIVVGLVLRDRGIIDWAEYVFDAGLQVPGARNQCMFERAVCAAVTDRPAESADLLARLEGEGPLSAYQRRAYATVLARTGELEGAVAQLEAAFAEEPWAVEEHVAYRQFLDFWAAHPLDREMARCLALLGDYRRRSTAEVAEDVLAALADGRPYALIRLNDGEGAHCHLSITDEARYGALYRRARAEFHRTYWFGDESMLGDPAFNRIVRQFNAVIGNADCLGAWHHLGLPVEYRWASMRNVPSMVNVVRKLEQVRDAPGFEPGRIAVTEPAIAHSLLYEGHLERIIRAQSRLGLVSWQVGLPAALTERFGVADIHFHRTAGEAPMIGGEMEPLGAMHARLSAELAGARPGMLYLVGAGIPGKVYCDIIKRAGGVALDIGSVADIWMKTPSRIYFADMSPYALTA